MAEQFAREADFFSIGSNDLTQYTLAMDRCHPALAARQDALHPAVLRLIALTGWSEDADRERTLEAGFDAHLTKPVDFEVLHALLLATGAA